MTVVLFNMMVNLGGRRTAYIVSALMSLVYIVIPMPELPWGVNRVFKYIAFYAVGVFLADRGKVVDRKIGVSLWTLMLLGLNVILVYFNLTGGVMWFVTAFVGICAFVLNAQLIYKNKILQYFGRISLMVLCIHGPVYRIVVKIVSIPLHMETDAVRENIFLAMLVVAITMMMCSAVYEIVVRIAPWMVGKSLNSK